MRARIKYSFVGLLHDAEHGVAGCPDIDTGSDKGCIALGGTEDSRS